MKFLTQPVLLSLLRHGLALIGLEWWGMQHESELGVLASVALTFGPAICGAVSSHLKDRQKVALQNIAAVAVEVAESARRETETFKNPAGGVKVR